VITRSQINVMLGSAAAGWFLSGAHPDDIRRALEVALENWDDIHRQLISLQAMQYGGLPAAPPPPDET
jgi:hypothetical protein